MKKPQIKTGSDFEKVCRKNGFNVRQGRGSHFVVKSPEGHTQTCYHGELSPGVKRQLKKFLAACGILLTLGLFFLITLEFKFPGSIMNIVHFIV